MQGDEEIYKRALQRERASRKAAEKILESKSTELYELNKELNAKNLMLEQNFVSKERELQDLFSNLVDGYVISDLEGFILNLNQSAKDIFEIKPTGTFNLFSLVSDQEKPQLNKGLQTLLNNKSLSDFELNIVTPSGISKVLLINASAVKDTDENIVALQALIKDVTSVRKLEADRELLLSKLKLQNHELEEFAHVISHDLKSPLRNLYTLNTWIRDSISESSDPKNQEYFSLIFSTLERMDTMISDVLEFSKSDKGEMSFVNVDLNEILTVISKQYLSNKNIDIQIVENIPKVYGVETKLFQVFQNLIDNAIKFSNKEKGVIKIYYEQMNEEKILIHIHDNGKGISERRQSKVFKLFETSENNKNSSGVGLAIVKKILDAHQSTIQLQSEENSYTKFSFDLKMA
jgi:PAS domain S-box-containing protein